MQNKKSLQYLKGTGFLIFVLLCMACRQASPPGNSEEGKETTVQLKQKTANLGKITQGEMVAHTFYFQNTGGHNLVIKNTESDCGCTTIEYDKAPLKPGKEGKIEIVFNSSGRYGKQYKEIRIFANVPEKVITLKFTADIR